MNSEKQVSGIRSKEKSGNFDGEAIRLSTGISTGIAAAVFQYNGQLDQILPSFNVNIKIPENGIKEDSCVLISISEVPPGEGNSILTINNINLNPGDSSITVRISQDPVVQHLVYRLKILVSNPVGV